jgi:hypothetical protein
VTDTDLDARRIRAARNQSMFREVNERIVELSDRWASLPQFVCECESAQCAETLEATGEEYDRVRSDPACFLVARGHNVPDVEDTVSENDRFMVVRKVGEGELIAVRYDPRRHDHV